jgi:hypothetical protein
VVEGIWLEARLRNRYGWPFRAPKHWLLTSAAIGAESQLYLNAYKIGHDSHVGPTNAMIFSAVAKDIAARLW